MMDREKKRRDAKSARRGPSKVRATLAEQFDFLITTFGMSPVEVYEELCSDHDGYWNIIIWGEVRKPL